MTRGRGSMVALPVVLSIVSITATAADRGVVDGILAVKVVPARAATGAGEVDCSGLSAHLAPNAAPAQEIVGPCGAWFLPPGEPMRYRVWLEGEGRVSARQIVLDWVRRRDDGSHGTVLELPMDRAGTVALAPAMNAAPGVSLDLVQLEAGFRRRVVGGAVHRGVLVPPGRVLAAMVDAEGNTVAVSRPTPVAAGGRAALTPSASPPPGVDLLVRLALPQPLAADERVTVELRDEGGHDSAPDAFGGDDRDLLAVWYGRTERLATLSVASERFWLPATQFTLGGGGVCARDLTVREKPTLHVELLLPDALVGSRALTVLDHRVEVRTVDVSAGATHLDLRHLPPSDLTAVLHVGKWRFKQEASLREGNDATVTFEPRVYHVHGTVTLGGEPLAATVKFTAAPSGGEVEARCDDDGRYSVLLFEECKVVLVRAPSLDFPFAEEVETLDADTTLDLALPARFLPITVRAADSGEPIAGAKAYLFNESSGGVADRLTGSDGKLRIGPLRPGIVRVTVEAAGFVPGRREYDVPGAETDLPSATFDLERVGDTTTVRFLLPNGSPAVGARAWMFPNLETSPTWGAAADARGEVEVPHRYSGMLGVRPDAAAIAVIPWPGGDDPGPGEVTLAPAAPPLTIVARPPGGTPMPGAMLRLWVGDMRLGPILMTVLLGGIPVTGKDGVWQARNLPQAPLAVLAWAFGPALNQQAAAGLLDAQRVTIPYPWPPVVELDPVH